MSPEWLAVCSLAVYQVMPNLGQALRNLRERAGLSQKQIATKAKLGAGQASRLEREERSPQASTLDAFLRACGADLYDLAAEIDRVNGRDPRPRGASLDAAIRAHVIQTVPGTSDADVSAIAKRYLAVLDSVVDVMRAQKGS